jgi:hypothetical protein
MLYHATLGFAGIGGFWGVVLGITWAIQQLGGHAD